MLFNAIILITHFFPHVDFRGDLQKSIMKIMILHAIMQSGKCGLLEDEHSHMPMLNENTTTHNVFIITYNHVT